jgi:hypothetical protein
VVLLQPNIEVKVLISFLAQRSEPLLVAASSEKAHGAQYSAAGNVRVDRGAGCGSVGLTAVPL